MVALSPLPRSDGHRLFSMENLYTAYRQCRRRKRGTYNALVFEQNLEENLVILHETLNDRSYQPSRSLVFMVEKPKRREIFAAAFRDRVVHHLLVNHLEPHWERRFIHDSFACRKDRGTHKGVGRLRAFTRKITDNETIPAWYLQLDIRGFFVAINRKILFERLAARESDPAVLWLIQAFVFLDPVQGCVFRNTFHDQFLGLPKHKTLFKAAPGCGLPIGNLTSQFFANVYLDALDQFVKHQLKVRFYVRYCDDFVLLAKKPEILVRWMNSIEAFLEEQLQLQLNEKMKLRPLADGIDFLGYIIRPAYLLVRKRVVGGLYEKLAVAEKSLCREGLGEQTSGRLVFPWPWPLIEKTRQWLASYQGHVRHASSWRLWEATIERFDWLQEYFVWKRGRLFFRYPPPRYARSFVQQKNYYTQLFPGHVLMIQLGTFWEMTAESAQTLPSPYGLDMRFTGNALKQIKGELWNYRVPVAWLAETGRRVTTISERVLVSRWDVA